MLTALALFFGGCTLPECESFCAARAECIAADIDAYETTWSDWTGYGNQDEYTAACLAEFEASRDDGASAEDLADVCTREEAEVCPAE